MKLVKNLSLLGSSVLLTSSLFGAAAAVKNATTAPTASKVEVGKPADTTPVIASENDSDKSAEVSAKEEAPKVQEPTKEEILSYFKTLGWMNIKQSGIHSLGPDAKEADAYLAGCALAIENKECPVKLGEVMEPMQKFFQKRSEEFEKKHREEMKVTAEKNRNDGTKYFENERKKDASIKVTSSGLGYKVIKEGDAKKKASDEDTVEIFYTGKLIDGKVFDECKSKPISFPLNGVVPGIKEGLKLVGEGGHVVLYLPSSLGYGDMEIPSIPAGSFLIFEVEVVKVNKVEKPAENQPDPASKK